MCIQVEEHLEDSNMQFVIWKYYYYENFVSFFIKGIIIREFMRILRIIINFFVLVYHNIKHHTNTILLSNIAKSINSNCNKFLLEGVPVPVHFKSIHPLKVNIYVCVQIILAVFCKALLKMASLYYRSILYS